jgi:uncharacterized protein
VRRVGPDQARRLALGAQGFARPRPTGRIDRRHLRRTLDDVRLLQLDSVNVCVRSHYMPLFSRLGPYRRPLIDEMAYDGRELFEYWGHEASLIPIGRYPALRHRMAAVEPWPAIRRILAEDPTFVDRVHAEVEERGPLSVGDLEDGGGRTGPWWGWGNGKIVLEWLFAIGAVTVGRRVAFTRFYDLPERVIPDTHRRADPLSPGDAHRALALDGLRGLGIGTIADVADYWRLGVPALRPVMRALVDEGLVEVVEVPGWPSPAYVDPAATIPRHVEARALLTPFDPVVWRRERAERLFGFHYRIEIYVPEPKRKFGYYVYPFLLGDRLVARVDLKAHRDRGVLEARAAWLEEGEDATRVAGELAEELESMAAWLDLTDVEVAQRGDLASALRASVGR